MPITDHTIETGQTGDGARPSGRTYLWLYLFTLPAVIGYWWFGLHPERLAGSQLAIRFYPISFQVFAQLHIVVAATILFARLVGVLRASWLPAFGAVALLSFAAEHIGTGYGWPFGGYGYTGLLGYKIGGRVPVLIPVSWFLMALPAWVMARSALPEGSSRAARALLAASWLVAWDLALDPAMSFLSAYWQWEEAGSYYGMPGVNLVGWLATGLMLMGALELAATRIPLWRIGDRWAAGYYAAVLAMPVGMLAAAGVWGAVAATAAGVGACAGATWLARRRAAFSLGAAPAPEALEA